MARSEHEHPSRAEIKLREISRNALDYANNTNMEPGYCLLFDAGSPAATNRFLIYDLAADSVIKRGKATHGRCNQQWLEGRTYSNVPRSGCTSIGKYRVGASYHGKYGLAFKLYGLDSSNSNAASRYIVLHGHDCVPEPSVTVNDLCQSDGCPTVSPGFMLVLQELLKQRRKPVLLWIYDSTQE